MGQKVNPIGLRLGVVRTWESRWFSDKDYAALLHRDIKMRNFIKKEYSAAGIARVVIERPAKKACVDIYASRPGLLIGKGGADLEKMKKKLSSIAGVDVVINIVNVRKPELDAYLIADGIARQIEKRVSYRRAMKRAMASAMKVGAVGIRINCSGRLGGAEIARMEWYREGRVPLHSLRSDIDFSVGVAETTYGACGIKVWVYRGDFEVGDFVSIDKRA